MDPPQMYVVGGPSGSGKSILFPPDRFGVDFFYVDWRAAELHGSPQGIPPEVRRKAGQECESFIESHILDRKSFATETTLRTKVALSQATRARANGFQTTLIYVSTDDPDVNVSRVTARGLAGGHCAPEPEIRAIYAASLRNLPAAVRVFDRVECFDTTPHGTRPSQVATFAAGELSRVACARPTWINELLRCCDQTTPL